MDMSNTEENKPVPENKPNEDNTSKENEELATRPSDLDSDLNLSTSRDDEGNAQPGFQVFHDSVFMAEDKENTDDEGNAQPGFQVFHDSVFMAEDKENILEACEIEHNIVTSTPVQRNPLQVLWKNEDLSTSPVPDIDLSSINLSDSPVDESNTQPKPNFDVYHDSQMIGNSPRNDKENVVETGGMRHKLFTSTPVQRNPLQVIWTNEDSSPRPPSYVDLSSIKLSDSLVDEGSRPTQPSQCFDQASCNTQISSECISSGSAINMPCQKEEQDENSIPCEPNITPEQEVGETNNVEEVGAAGISNSGIQDTEESENDPEI